MTSVENGLLEVSAEVVTSHELFDGIEVGLHIGCLTLVVDGLQDGALLGRQCTVLEACYCAQEHPNLLLRAATEPA